MVMMVVVVVVVVVMVVVVVFAKAFLKCHRRIITVLKWCYINEQFHFSAATYEFETRHFSCILCFSVLNKFVVSRFARNLAGAKH